MIQTVLKRDGRVVGFNEEKIVAAVRRAMLHTDKGEDMQLAHEIADRIACRGQEQMSVEDIQNCVEIELMKSRRKDVAQLYIAYRNQRSVARKAKTRDIFLEIIETKSNEVTRENANMNADTPAGMMMKFSSETTKPFVDDYLLVEEVKNAVRQGYLHIHDKDYYPTKTDSMSVMVNPVRQNGSRRLASSVAFRSRRLRMKCMADRRFRLLIFIWHLMCGIVLSKR